MINAEEMKIIANLGGFGAILVIVIAGLWLLYGLVKDYISKKQKEDKEGIEYLRSMIGNTHKMYREELDKTHKMYRDELDKKDLTITRLCEDSKEQSLKFADVVNTEFREVKTDVKCVLKILENQKGVN